MSRDPTRTMPLMGHLSELRKRITYAAIAVVVMMIGAFIAHTYVWDVLMYPLRHTKVTQLAVFAPTEAFMQVLKVSIYAGLILALPIILWQFWAFIMPALYENEKKSIVPYVFLTCALFMGGIAFGYFVVLPVGLRFLIGYGGGTFNQLLRAEYYVSFVSMFELAFGLVFELPLIMMLLAWAGILDHVKMRKWRKYAILVMAIIAMVLTPSQDPVSMMLMFAPLLVLYEFGIVLARAATNRRTRRRERAALDEAENATTAEVGSGG